MENNNNKNNKNVVGHGSASSLDHLFGPRESPTSASSSSTSAGLFNSIFPPPSMVLGREKKRDLGNQFGDGKFEKSDNMAQSRKGESSGVTSKDSSNIYQNESVEPCYFSSSIYYGGQENYSPRTRTNESQHIFKKDGSEDDPNGNNSNGASRGNWWQGSLYY